MRKETTVPGIFSSKEAGAWMGVKDMVASKLKLSMAVGAALLAGSPTLDAQVRPELRRFEYSQIHMGGAVKLTLFAESESKAENAAKAAYARFAELEQVLSDYRPSSEINRLCRTAIYGPVPVSEDLYRNLKRALEVAELTDGAYDPTVGPLVALWRTARQTGKLPSPQAIQEAKARVGWRFIELDERRRTVFIKKVGVRVDFGGIAKGDGCDQVIKVLKTHGIENAMVEAGGDLKVSGAPPGSSGWVISILGLRTRLILKDRAVSTSGDAEQFVEIDGVRYSHIVDPKTGLGVTNRRQATVMSSLGLNTDPLATAVCVIGQKRAERALARYGARVIVKEGS